MTRTTREPRIQVDSFDTASVTQNISDNCSAGVRPDSAIAGSNDRRDGWNGARLMLTKLVSIPTERRPLDGLLYRQRGSGGNRAALIMHGNAMNFYYGPSRFLPPALGTVGIDSVAFNRHGHDTISAYSRVAEGSAYQSVAEAEADNESAGRYLLGMGYAPPVIIGHSHGGLLAAMYVARHPETPALVLLSAHCGGSQMLESASSAGLFAAHRLAELRSVARDRVAAGHGDDLMLMPGWYFVTTAASFLDMDRNLPRLLDIAPKITCPTLFVRGDQEDRERYPAERFADAIATQTTAVRVIDHCGHFYEGHEQDVAGLVSHWLDSLHLKDATDQLANATGSDKHLSSCT